MITESSVVEIQNLIVNHELSPVKLNSASVHLPKPVSTDLTVLFLVEFNRYLSSSKFFLREHAFIWNRDSDLFLRGILMLYISSVS